MFQLVKIQLKALIPKTQFLELGFIYEMCHAGHGLYL